MNKPMKKAFSVGLVVCLLLSVLPASATAEAIEADGSLTSSMLENQITVNDTISETSVSDDMTVIREETSLRGAYEKHFLMSDGSYQAVLYNEPVHKLTDGQWVEIDNTLTLQSGRYATADGLTDVSFSSSFGDDLVTMEQGSYTLSWGVQAVSNSLTATATAQAQLVTTDLSGFTAEEQMTMAVKSSSSIHYPNALRQNVDLEYIVLPSRVKENIILQSAQDISFYMVTVYAENLSARLLENRQIEFYNENDEVIFTMASPYMYDSAGELSEDITVELAEKSGGVYFIKMTPDAGWLADESRVYPVVIDPEVSTDTTQQNIIDNYVLEGAGVQNYNLDRLYIGNKSGSTAQAYIQFAAMPTIPTGSTITSATMTTTIVSGTSTAYNASAYMVTGDEWTSSTIQWSNKPAAEAQLEANISHNNKTKYQFSCLAAVQHWYDSDTTGQNENYGVMIRYYDETIADYNSFYSADHTDETLRPAIVITYQTPTDSVGVDEGDTCTLTAPDVAGTITWTSDKPSIATVSSSGVVTAIKAGKAIVSAAVGDTVYKTYTVHVTIADGVYRIRSHVGLLLATYGDIAENTPVKLRAYSSSGLEQMCQLWKITYLGDGYYSIRPMHKLNMALHAGGTAGSSVDIVSAGINDTLDSVAPLSRWGISASSDGDDFYISHVATTSLGLKAADGAPAVGMGVDIAVNPLSQGAFEWSLELVTGIFAHDSNREYIDISTPVDVEVEMGDTYTLAQMGYYLTASNLTVGWSSDDDATISVDNAGKVTASKRGKAAITASGASDSTQYTFGINVTSIETVYVKNYYDKTLEGDSTLLGYIDDAVDFLNIAFQYDFHLKFVADGQPIRYTDAATDICPNGAWLPCQYTESSCTITDCDSHHKNINRIGDEMYQLCFEQNHVVVLWTNNAPGIFCVNDGGHTLVAALAATPYERGSNPERHLPVVEVLNINKLDTAGLSQVASDKICMSLVLAHEIAHTLEMYEMYTWHSDHMSDEEYKCIMHGYDPAQAEAFYNKVISGEKNALCETCSAILNEEILDDVYEY